MHYAFVVGVGLCCALLLAANPAAADDAFTFQHDNVLGTSLDLRVFAARREPAERAEGRVLIEIDRLAGIFSTYSDASEFSRWQRTPVGQSSRISRELLELLAASDRYRQLSGGAFQPAAQVLTKLWSQCEAQQRLPLPAELAMAVASADRTHWRLDSQRRAAERLTGAPLSLNAIATGYIVDRACEAA